MQKLLHTEETTAWLPNPSGNPENDEDVCVTVDLLIDNENCFFFRFRAPKFGTEQTFSIEFLVISLATECETAEEFLRNEEGDFQKIIDLVIAEDLPDWKFWDTWEG